MMPRHRVRWRQNRRVGAAAEVSREIRYAARAGAKHLVLTHFTQELGADWVVSEAARAFDGTVSAAHEGAVYDVGK